MLFVTISAGCAGSDTVDPLVADLDDLCEAAADDADLAQQESAFFDRAHDAIHDLAVRVTDRDPARGAALLEAKQVVESGLAEASEALADEPFKELIAAVDEALAEIEMEPLPC